MLECLFPQLSNKWVHEQHATLFKEQLVRITAEAKATGVITSAQTGFGDAAPTASALDAATGQQLQEGLLSSPSKQPPSSDASPPSGDESQQQLVWSPSLSRASPISDPTSPRLSPLSWSSLVGLVGSNYHFFSFLLCFVQIGLLWNPALE